MRPRAVLRQLLFENLPMKLISFGLAFVIWYWVASLQPRDITLYNVPVSVVDHRADAVITAVGYKRVNLRVRGRLKQLATVSPLAVPVVLDVTSLGAGDHSVWIDPAKVQLPGGVEILRVDPVNVPVTIENVISKSVPVEVLNQADGILPGRILVGVNISPPQVMLTGTESQLSGVRVYQAGTVDWQPNTSQDSATKILPVSLGSLKVSPGEITLTATFDRVTEMNFPRVSVEIPPRVAWVSPRTLTLTIRGADSWVRRLTRRDLVARVEVSSLPPGEHLVTPTLKTSGDVQRLLGSAEFEPARIRVLVR